MKTPMLRVWTLGLAISSLVFCVGCEEDKASAEVPVFTNPVTFFAAADAKPDEALNLEEAAPAILADAAKAATTNAPPTNPPARLVQTPVVPDHLKVSPALREVLKLVEAGVSEEVILTYITNSTNIFDIGPDEIVYLTDLGVSSTVVTTLIQHDTSPDTLARRQAADAVKPLPPGVALTAPATNVYPATASPQNAVNALPPGYEEAAPATAYAPTDYGQQPVTVNYFYSSLAPYGNWVDVDGYGLCWQPTVAVVNPYWRPYCDRGRWLWSDCGWYWYSDYSWGWAPFHYGRWCSSASLGWYWVPDTCWGPSWVTWRYTRYHCGWAPLPPACHYVNGFGLLYHNSSVALSFDFGLSPSCYTFIPLNRFCDPAAHLYYVSPGHATTIYKDSTVINNYIVGNNNTIINKGIGLDPVAKVTRSEIPKATIRDASVKTGKTTRPERLQHDGSSLVVVRPQLPKDPPQIKPQPVAHPPRPAKTQPAVAAKSLSAEAGKTAPAASVDAKFTSTRADLPLGGSQANAAGVNQSSTLAPAKGELAKPSRTHSPSADAKAVEQRPAVIRSVPHRSTPLIQEKPTASAVETPKAPTAIISSKQEEVVPSRSSVLAPPTFSGRSQNHEVKGDAAPGFKKQPAIERNQPVAEAPRNSSPPAPAVRGNTSPPTPAAPKFGAPANQSSSAPSPNRQLSAPAFARSENTRVFAEPSRPSESRQQVAPPQFSRPAPVINAPPSRPQFTPPPSVFVPAPRPEPPRQAPVFSRPEPVHPAAPPSISAPPRPVAPPPISAPSHSASSVSAPPPASRSSGSGGSKGNDR